MNIPQDVVNQVDILMDGLRSDNLGVMIGHLDGVLAYFLVVREDSLLIPIATFLPRSAVITDHENQPLKGPKQ
jgi:hypothetical protein